MAVSAPFSETIVEQLQHHRISILLIFLPIVALLTRFLYNLWFHPLASYPGPIIARSTRLWRDQAVARGVLHFEVHRLHEKYGPVVRIAPDELSYVDSAVWKDVWGRRPEVPKSRDFYDANQAGDASIIGAENPKHAELRRLLAHGFSEKALKQQESTMQHYASLLIKRLYENCEDGKKALDVVSWYNYFSFDAIGDLTFGESFGSLEHSRSNPWIDAIIGDLHSALLFTILNQWSIPVANLLAPLVIPKEAMEHREYNFITAKEKALKRRDMTGERHDFMIQMAKPSAVSEKELIMNSIALIGPGSETAATVLSGTTFFLLKNPRVLKKLAEEVRSSFSSADEITFLRVSQLKYMLAVLDEALRMYPPVPANLPRRTSKDLEICGKHVPPNTKISVYQWAMFRSPKNFKRPNEFIPERHLGDQEFQDDDRFAFQPFNYGPRSCLGKNLAYFEMRLVLAKVLYHFDLEPAADLRDWPDQKVWFVWQKKPLWVKLKPVRPL